MTAKSNANPTAKKSSQKTPPQPFSAKECEALGLDPRVYGHAPAAKSDAKKD